MTSATQKFAWKDRDTAAYNILRMVYHAPPSISELGIHLLEALRSPRILPELQSMFFEETQQRFDILKIIAKTDGDVLIPELEKITQEGILNPSNFSRYRYRGSALNEIIYFVDKHPSNRGWFFDILDNLADKHKLLSILRNFTYPHHSDDFRRILISRLLNFIDENSHFLELSVVGNLTRYFEYSHVWLEAHVDEIVALCMRQIGSDQFRFVVQNWSHLADILRQKIDNFDAVTAHKEIWNPKLRTKYLESPAYQYLYRKYIEASEGDAFAGYCLGHVSNQRKGDIPFRAVGVHFYGQLYEKSGGGELALHNLMRYESHDWVLFSSPVRYEAGEASLKLPTSKTWEILVDSFFIAPRPDLIPYQKEWIAYITDVLSGDTQKQYDGIRYGEPSERSWFHALADISEEELQELTKDIR